MSERPGSFGDRPGRRAVPLLALAVAFGGCDSTTAPEPGHVAVALARASNGGAPLLAEAALRAAPELGVGAVPLASVSSMTLDVTAVEIHRVAGDEEADGSDPEGADGSDGEESGAWTRIELTSATAEEVDVVDLPEAESPDEGFQVALDAVPAGTYNLVRIFFDGISLSFAEEVTVDGTVFPAETPVDLDIRVPSGDQTGIQVLTGPFEVPAGGTAGILLVLDPETSLKNVTANADGIILTPVVTGVVDLATREPPPDA